MEKITDIFSIVGGTPKQHDAIKSKLNNIRVNNLYDDEKLLSTNNLNNRWFTNLS